VELLDGLLPGADRDLVKPLEKRLRESFKSIMLSTEVLGLGAAGDKVTVEMEGPDGAKFKNEYDRVLVAVGRRPKSSGLGLENTKVTLDDKGFVQVDAERSPIRRLRGRASPSSRPNAKAARLKSPNIRGRPAAGRSPTVAPTGSPNGSSTRPPIESSAAASSAPAPAS
jgi:hypothetical protein